MLAWMPASVVVCAAPPEYPRACSRIFTDPPDAGDATKAVYPVMEALSHPAGVTIPAGNAVEVR